jgi:hypothetical protein|tara:strand:- start:50 stop:355 length:306 start_codon:yes stop_codon:yes gene_type:complete
MPDNIRELDQVQAELDILHERSQNNKANISSHEAVCEVRHKIIMENMDAISKELRVIHLKLNDVQELATKGKTSLHTLLWAGGVVAGLVTLFSVLYNMLPK